MIKPKAPENETQRLQALRDLEILDTEVEDRFDRITRIVCRALEVPISAVSLIDERRQWFKSVQGLAVRETPRDVAFCAHAILRDDPLIVTDATADPRFADNPLVRGEPHIRFYAGLPLSLPGSLRIGTLCAIDSRPRDLTEEQLQILTDLRSIVETELRLKSALYSVYQSKIAEDEAKRSVTAKAKFLATMSHEIRTPVNGIMGITQLLQAQPLTPPQRRLVNELGNAGQLLLRIVDDILDFSKIEAYAFRITCKPFHLGQAMERVADLLESLARKKGLGFSVSCAPELKDTSPVGDVLRLEQVLLNLIGNAIKFTEKGKVSVLVGLPRESAHKNRIRFEICDTGTGIDPTESSSLFQPFSQAGSAEGFRSGTGLGLSISKQLVELMGGEIGYDSVPGAGTTFWFELPLRFDESPVPSETSDQHSVGTFRLAGLRCLVADDTRLNRMVIKQMLELEGATVTSVGNGEQAISCIHSQPDAFDVVLMDVQMPVMDGLTATRKIRAGGSSRDLPVIALTAGVLPEQKKEAQTAGCDGFLAKPVILDELVEALKLHVLSKGSRDKR